jgi:hypothetical protein
MGCISNFGKIRSHEKDDYEIFEKEAYQKLKLIIEIEKRIEDMWEKE